MVLYSAWAREKSRNDTTAARVEFSVKKLFFLFSLYALDTHSRHLPAMQKYKNFNKKSLGRNYNKATFYSNNRRSTSHASSG